MRCKPASSSGVAVYSGNWVDTLNRGADIQHRVPLGLTRQADTSFDQGHEGRDEMRFVIHLAFLRLVTHDPISFIDPQFLP